MDPVRRASPTVAHPSSPLLRRATTPSPMARPAVEDDDEPRGRSRSPRVLAGQTVRFAAAPPDAARSQTPFRPRPLLRGSGHAMGNDWEALRGRIEASLSHIDQACEQVTQPQQREALKAAVAELDVAQLDVFVRECAQQADDAQKRSRQSTRLIRGIAQQANQWRTRLNLPEADPYSSSSFGGMVASVRSFFSDLPLGAFHVPPLTPDLESSEEEWVDLFSQRIRRRQRSADAPTLAPLEPASPPK